MRADLILNLTANAENASQNGQYVVVDDDRQSRCAQELFTIIRAEVDRVAQACEVRTDPQDTLVDLGTVLVSLVRMSSLLGNGLWENQQFREYLQQNSIGSDGYRRPADMDHFNRLWEHFRQLRARLQDSSDSLQGFWSNGVPPSTPSPKISTHSPPQLSLHYILSPRESPPTNHSRGSGSDMSYEFIPMTSGLGMVDGAEEMVNGSPILEDSAAARITHILNTLKQRGKGDHRCPYGFDCDKGGVVGNQLVLFERNSLFRSHCEKHTKRFKCDLPNCRNKVGFARRDQLERHQNTVDHGRETIREHKRRKSEAESP